MSFEIRPITDDEVERAEQIRAYSFNDPERRNLSQAVQQAREFFPLDWTLATFEDGEMTAFMRTMPFPMRLNGRPIAMGAVGPVVAAPEHRRKGHVAKLLRRSIEIMHERGQAISLLGTPHPHLYRRYGWEIAASFRTYSFPPKQISLLAQPRERGRIRMLSPDDWQEADGVYRRWGEKRNGTIHRRPLWWQYAIFTMSQPVPADVALWEDGSGEAQGYAVFHQPNSADGQLMMGGAFFVREVVGLTADAYLNLLQFICRHDLVDTVRWGAPMDDPFFSLVADNYVVSIKEEYGNLLRVIDVEAALRSRAPARPDIRGALTLRLTDSAAPWNEGTWRVEVSDGEMRAERSAGEPDLSLSTTAFAPVFNGYARASALALGGLIEARNEDVLAAADEMFSALHPPYLPDPF